jgi:hypothetical protein
LLKTRTSKPPQQQNTTPQEAKHPGRRQRNQGGRFLAEKQTAKRSRNASARFPARSPRVFCVFFESGGGGGARLSSPTTRSVGRSAVAERAPNARITHSTGRAVRVARDSRRCAEVRLFAFETTSLAVARRRSPRSTRSPSSRSRCRVKIHVYFPSQAATSPCKNIRGRGQPARRRTTRRHTPSPSLRTKSGDRRDETKKRRCGGGGRAAAAVV